MKINEVINKGGKIRLVVVTICAFLVVVILSLQVIDSKPDSNINVDPLVIEELENKNEVHVMVTLRELKESSSKSERKNVAINEIIEIVDKAQSEIIPNLRDDEFQIKHIFELSPSFSGNITKEGFKKLSINPNVESITKVERIYGILDESVSLINATNVHSNLNYSGEGITVCIIDSGINYTHPNLGGCFGSGCKIKAGYDFVDNDGDPMDEHGHGTHVIGAIASNDSTFMGVAPNVSIVAIRVLDENNAGNTDDMKKGLEWCRLNAV